MIRITMAKGQGELRAQARALLVLTAKIFVLGLPVPAAVQHSACVGTIAYEAVQWPCHQTDLD